jgi:uncharacterized protein YndB with AHSA1/START domain
MFAAYHKKSFMSTSDNTPITVSATINAPIEKIWQYWTMPEHITQWNYASEEWHSPRAENDFQVGGRFVTRMEAKDGSMGFDFSGVNSEIRQHEHLGYTLDDGRKVVVSFKASENQTEVTETFDPESVNPRELQQMGWQAILNNFKKYVEGNR